MADSKKTSKKGQGGASKTEKKCPPRGVNACKNVLKAKVHTPSGQEALKELNAANRAKCGEAKKAPAKEAPAKEAPAKKAPAKKAPASKKAPAKKAPAKEAPAKKAPAKAAPASNKPKSQRSYAPRDEAMKRLAEGTKSSMQDVNRKLDELLNNRTPAAAARKKKAPKRVAKPLPLSYKEAVDAVAAGMNGVSAAKIDEAMQRLAKEHGMPRAANPVQTPTATGLAIFENNPAARMTNPQYSAGQVAVGVATIGVSFTLVNMLDRGLATWAPKGCKVYGDEAVLRLSQKPGLLRLGVQAGLAVVGVGASWMTYKRGMGMTSAIIGGIGLAAGIQFIYMGLSSYFMPLILSAKDNTEESLGNRLYPAEQKYVQDYLATTIEAHNKACEQAAGKAVRTRILHAYYAKRLGLPAAGNGNANAGTAGAPRPPTPSLPARGQPAGKDATAGTAGPARGEPRAENNAQAGTAGCGCGGKCGGKGGCNKKPLDSETAGPPEFYKVATNEWYDAKGKLLGTGPMEGAAEAMKAGVHWFQKSTGRWYAADGETEIKVTKPSDTSAAAGAAGVESNGGASAVVDGMAVPTGKRVAVIKLSNGDQKIVLEDDRSSAAAGTAAPPAAPAAPAASDDRVLNALGEIQSSLKSLNHRVSAVEGRAEGSAAAGTAAPPAVTVVSKEAAPVAKVADATPEDAPLAPTGTDPIQDPFAVN